MSMSRLSTPPVLRTAAALALAALLGGGAASHASAAPPSNTSELHITTQAKLDAQLKGRGLENRHLATCQDARSATPRGQMASLEYLAGHWEGLGWSAGDDGTISHYVQTEDIGFTDPTHLDVRGTGHDPKNLTRIVFSAHAIASPRADGTIQWLALSEGNELDTTLVTLPDGWSWDVPFPGGMVRYETHYTHGGRAWHETGRMTMDGGATWRTIQDMTLVKTCDL